MEVMHEPHHERPGKEIKAWKHYAMEFFMLFLAVSAGFLSENLRERIVENDRAKEMAYGLYNELDRDSLQIYKMIIRKKHVIKEMNSLMNTFSQEDYKNKITLLTYYQASFLMEVDMPVPANANLNQLINSGSLRYFKNKKLVSDISQWDNYISNQFQERHETDEKRLIEEIKSVNRVFNPITIDSMRNYSFESLFDENAIDQNKRNHFDSTPAKLITNDSTYIYELLGWASERKRNAIVRSTDFLPLQLEHIRNLMRDLNEEFKIKKN